MSRKPECAGSNSSNAARARAQVSPSPRPPAVAPWRAEVATAGGVGGAIARVGAGWGRRARIAGGARTTRTGVEEEQGSGNKGESTLAELALRVDGVGEGRDHAEEAGEIHGARVIDVPVGNHFLRVRGQLQCACARCICVRWEHPRSNFNQEKSG
jgi:hypothetical protein